MFVDNRANFATGLGMTGRLNEGLAIAEEAVEISQKIGTLWAKSISISTTSQILQEMGRLDEAISALNQAIRLGDEANFFGPHYYDGSALAFILGKLGDYQLALRKLSELAEESLQSSQFSDWWEPTIMQTILYIDMDDIESADLLLEAPRKEISTIESDIQTYPHYVIAEGRIFLAKRQIQQGLEQMEQGIAAVQASGFKVTEPEMKRIVGLLLQSDERLEEATKVLREAAALARNMGSKWQLLPILRDLAKVEEKNGDLAGATKTRKEAKEVLNFMVGHLTDRILQQKFLNLPANREIIGYS